MAKSQLQFSDKDEWFTPLELIKFFGNDFDYDPATTKELAKKFNIPYFDTKETNGLSRDWTLFEKIWINPPFSKKFDFLEKAVDSIIRNPRQTILFVFPVDSLATKKFHKIIPYYLGYTIWLPNERIAFETEAQTKSSPAFSSVIIELGGYPQCRMIKHFNLENVNGFKKSAF